jgi:hypothetical protein
VLLLGRAQSHQPKSMGTLSDARPEPTNFLNQEKEVELIAA